MIQFRKTYQLVNYLMNGIWIIMLHIALISIPYTISKQINTPWIDKVNSLFLTQKHDLDTNMLVRTNNQLKYVLEYQYGDPSPAEQAHLEAINYARLHPFAEADRLGIYLFEGIENSDITGFPVQPLTFNLKLYNAAKQHAVDMIVYDYFDHTSLDGKTPFDRMINAGYSYNAAGENIAYYGSTGPIDRNKIVVDMHDELFIDDDIEGRGHRVNILYPSFKEIGIGSAFGSYKKYPNSCMLTCDFGLSNYPYISFILGVVYNDKNGNDFYDPGEGLNDIAISISSEDSQTLSIKTASAGGYGVPVSPGTYIVSCTLPDDSKKSQSITMVDKNIKVDFIMSDKNDAEDSLCFILLTTW